MIKGAPTLAAIMLCMVAAFGQTAPRNAEELAAVRQRAGAGDANAQAALGLTYEYGLAGAQRDLSEALKWYRRAAEQGDVNARYALAERYFDGRGVEKDYAEAARLYRCPKPNIPALSSCREIVRMDLPVGALDLLEKLKCDVGPSSNYDYGSAVDLNGDGNPEYLVCCNEAPHGPCNAVVIGKAGSAWKDLTAKEGVAAYTPACGLFVVLGSQHSGFSDVCLPNQCSLISDPSGKLCVPTIWNLIDGRYRSVKYTPVESPK